jgi:hypothetical protein
LLLRSKLTDANPPGDSRERTAVPLSVEIREHFETVEDRMEAAFASSRKLEFPASVTEALRNSGEIPK